MGIAPAPPTRAPNPPGVEWELRRSDFHTYQRNGVQHVISNPKSMLWLFLGAGKTIVTLTAFGDMQIMGLAKKMLVVAPLRVCELQWEQEMNKWEHTHEHFKFSKMIGSAKKRQAALFSEADIYMVNYESLGWLALQLDQYFIKQGLPLPFDFIVFDEVSKMKAANTSRFKAFAEPICPHFPRRSGLTASPASNGATNLWGQFFCLDSGERLGKTYKGFTERFFRKLDGEYGKYVPFQSKPFIEGDRVIQQSSLEMIVSKISDMTLEVPADGNVEMEPLTILDITVTLPPMKMKQYLELEKDFLVTLDNGSEVEVFNSASLGSKLLQFSNGIIYNYPDAANPDYRTEESVHTKKYEALDEIVEDAGDEPIFLVYNFTSERDEIMRKYPDAKCMAGASEEEAVELQNRFNSGELKMLITHPLSSGYGLNLQKACAIIVWFGMNYNLELYEQTIGRINRQGQKRPVRCYRILAKDTMDQVVSDALKEKDKQQTKIKKLMNDANNMASQLELNRQMMDVEHTDLKDLMRAKRNARGL